MLEWTFAVVSHPLMPWVSVALILLWGFATWFSFRFKLVAVYQMLDEACLKIETHLDVPDFVTPFKDLDAELIAIDGIKEPWERFRDTLVVSNEGVVQGPLPPDSFFNSDTLVQAQLDLGYYRAMPAYLVAVGLIFTFVSFIAAFSFIYHGLSSPDPGAVKFALGQLLNTAAFKFSASIAGLFTALLFSLGEKFHSRYMEQRISHLCQLLTERVDWVSDDKLLQQRLAGVGSESSSGAVLESLVAESEQLRGTSSRIDQTLTAMDDKISALGGFSIEPVIENIKDQSGQILQQLQKQQSMDTVIESIQGESAKILEHLSSQLSMDGVLESIREESFQIREQLENQPALDGVLERIDAGTAQILEQLQSKTTMNLEVAGPDTPAAPRMVAGVANIDEVVATLKAESQRQLTAVDGAIQSAMVEINNGLRAVGSLDAVAETVKNEIERMTGTLRSYSFIEPVISEIKSEGKRAQAVSERLLRDMQDDMGHKLRHPAFISPIVEAVTQETALLLQKDPRKITLESAVEQVDGEAVAGVVVRQDPQQELLTPLLKSVQAEGERISGDLDKILALVRQEVGRLRQEQELIAPKVATQIAATTAQQTAMAAMDGSQKPEAVELAEAKAAVHLETVLATIRSEFSQFSAVREQAIRDAVAEVAIQTVVQPAAPVTNATLMEPLRELLTETTRKIERNFSLDSVIQLISRESSQVSKNQLDVLGALNRESELLSSRIEKRIETIIPQLASHIDKMNFSAEIITAFQAEAERMVEKLVAVEDLPPVIAAVNAETNRVANQLREQLSTEPLLAAIADEGDKVAAGFSEIVDTIKDEGKQIAEGRDLAVIEAVSQVRDPAEDAANMDRVIEAIKAEGAQIAKMITRFQELLGAAGDESVNSEGRQTDEPTKLQGETTPATTETPLPSSELEGAEVQAVPEIAEVPAIPDSAEVQAISENPEAEAPEVAEAPVPEGVGAVVKPSELLSKKLPLHQATEAPALLSPQTVEQLSNSQEKPARLEDLLLEGAFDADNKKAAGLLPPEAVIRKGPPSPLFDKDWARDLLTSNVSRPAQGVEMIGVDLETFAGNNRERYFFGLLTNIASQLSGRAVLDTKALQQTINTLLQAVRSGEAIANKKCISELVKLGEQVDKIDLSALEGRALHGLDDAFMGLANFLRGYIKESQAAAPSAPKIQPVSSQHKSIKTDTLAICSGSAQPEVSAQELKKLMDSFEIQRGRKKPPEVLAEPQSEVEQKVVVESEVALDVGAVAANLQKLMDTFTEQNTPKKILPALVSGKSADDNDR